MVRLELVDRIIKIPANKEVLVMYDDNPEEFLIRIPRALLTYDVEQSTVFLLTQLNDSEPRIEVLEPYYGEDDWIDYLWKVKKEYTAIEGYLTIQLKIVRDVEELPQPVDPVDPVEPAKKANLLLAVYTAELGVYTKTMDYELIILNSENKEEDIGSAAPGDERLISLNAGDYTFKVLNNGFYTVKNVKVTEEDVNNTTDDSNSWKKIEIIIDLDDPEPDPGPEEPNTNDIITSHIISEDNNDSNETEEPTEKPAGNDDPWEDVDPGILFPIGENITGVWYSYQNKFKITKALNVLL